MSLLLCMRQDTQYNRPPEIEALENRTLFSAALTASFIGHVPSQLPVAGTSQITVHLTNPGKTAVVEPATLQVFASPTPLPTSSPATSPTSSPDPAEVLLGTHQETLKLKGHSTANTRFTIASPTTLPTGNYFLVTELNGQVMTSSPVQIQAPLSNLAVSFAGLPGKPIEIDGWSAGKRTAALDVTDTGNVAINGNVNLSLYLSSDGQVDGTQTLLATIPNVKVALKPGKSKVVQVRIAVPPGTAVGGYFLIGELVGTDALTTAVTASSSTVVSTRRVAVVSQLPVPIQVNNSVNVVNAIGGGDCCDTTPVYVDDGGGVIVADSGGDSGGYADVSDSDGSDDSGSDDSGADDSGSDDSDSGDDDSND